MQTRRGRNSHNKPARIPQGPRGTTLMSPPLSLRIISLPWKRALISAASRDTLYSCKNRTTSELQLLLRYRCLCFFSSLRVVSDSSFLYEFWPAVFWHCIIIIVTSLPYYKKPPNDRQFQFSTRKATYYYLFLEVIYFYWR